MDFIFTKTPLVFLVQDFWRDEAFSFFLAKKNVFEIARLSLSDFTPPLYAYLLKLWMFFFGGSEIALRSLSLIFFVFMLFAAFHLFLDVYKYNHGSSFFGMLLFLINPLLLYYAFEARPYSMFACLAVVSFYAYLTNKKKLYLISTIAGLYTHYFMIFALIIQMFHAYTLRGKRDYNLKLKMSGYALVAFLPWFAAAIFQKAAHSTQFWIEKTSAKDLIYLPGIMYSGFEKDFAFPNPDIFGYPKIVFLLSLLLLAYLIIFYLKNKVNFKIRKDSYIFLMLLWAAVPIIGIFFLSFVKPLFLPRYLILCTPAILFLLVAFFENFKLPLKLFLILLLVGATLQYNMLQIKHRTKAHVSPIFQEIAKQASPSDVIYTPNELDYFLAKYYGHALNVYIYAKNYADIPDYVGKALIPESAIKTVLPFYPAKAFIFSGNSYTIQSLD